MSGITLSIPADTARAAKAAFGVGNLYLLIGDSLSTLLRDINRIELSGSGGQSQTAIPRLSLVTVFQFIEELTDSQAAEATRTRVDWKYALHLSMNYPGISDYVLCQHRQHAFADPALQCDIQLIYERLVAFTTYKDSLSQRFEAAEILMTVCTLNRMEWIKAAIAQAMEIVAVKYPDWLRSIMLPHWFNTYISTDRHYRPSSEREKPSRMAQAIGLDIQYLLKACWAADQLELESLPEIHYLQQVLCEQFELYADAQSPDQHVRWRQMRCSFCNRMQERLPLHDN